MLLLINIISVWASIPCSAVCKIWYFVIFLNLLSNQLFLFNFTSILFGVIVTGFILVVIKPWLVESRWSARINFSTNFTILTCKYFSYVTISSDTIAVEIFIIIVKSSFPS